MKITVTAVAAVALALAYAGPASAGISGLQLVGANSAYDSVNKQKIVVCPSGRQVIGAAGHIEAPLGRVIMDDMTPASNLIGVGVTGFEDHWGIQQDWDLTAYAICAHPPAGLVRIVATSPANSEDKSVTAKCPVGKKVLGTGGDIVAPLSAGGQVGMVSIEPDSELTDVTVKGAEINPYLYDDWSVRAYAICAPAPAGLTLHWSQPVGPEQPEMAAVVTAYCPKGKRVLGVGGWVKPDPWVDYAGMVAMTSIAPDENLKSVTVIGAKMAVAGKQYDSFRVDAQAYAICAPADWTPGGWSPSHG